MKALLRLYPRAWRQRYGDEMTALLAQEQASIRLMVDLIAGAIDARLNPQQPLGGTAGDSREGVTTMGKLRAYCHPQELTTADHLRSAAWMIGGTLVLVLTHMALRRIFGKMVLIEAFGLSAFPFALVLAMRITYFKPYSRTARIVMMAALMIAAFLLSLAGVWIDELT